MKTSRKLMVFLLVLAVGLLLSATMVSAQDGTVIRIASQTPLSGPQSILGTGIRNGAELAIAQLAGPLTEMGYTVEFVPFDDQATPDVGVANAQNIVNDAAILAVIGHLNSGVALPSSEVYNDNDLVMVSPANTNVNITDRGYATVNRICGRDDAQGAAGAQFAASIDGVSSVYIIHDTTAYGLGVAEFFQAEAEAQGLVILGFEGTEEASNFEGIIQPILALAPDLIYFGGLYPQSGIFINQARMAGYTGLFMGPDGFDSSEFSELSGDAGVGTYYTTVAAPVTIYPDAADFAASYEEQYGESPQPFAAQSYDSTGIVLQAIAGLIEANGALPSRAEVAAAVRATEGYAGITGTYSFDDNGDPEIGQYYILSVGSADPADWNSNELLSSQNIPSPLTVVEPEATPST